MCTNYAYLVIFPRNANCRPCAREGGALGCCDVLAPCSLNVEYVLYRPADSPPSTRSCTHCTCFGDGIWDLLEPNRSYRPLVMTGNRNDLEKLNARYTTLFPRWKVGPVTPIITYEALSALNDCLLIVVECSGKSLLPASISNSQWLYERLLHFGLETSSQYFDHWWVSALFVFACCLRPSKRNRWNIFRIWKPNCFVRRHCMVHGESCHGRRWRDSDDGVPRSANY